MIHIIMDQVPLTKPHKFFFETLGNRARWEIVHLLLQKPYRATAIAAALGYEQSLTSHHLRRLEACGFVRARRNGSERIYSINRTTIAPLLRLVARHVNRFCRKACCP